MKALVRVVAFSSLLASLALLRAAAAMSLTLDDFDGPAGGQSVSITNASIHESAQDLASGTGAVGDTRQIVLGVFETSGGSSFVEAAVNSGTSGKLAISQSTGISSRTTIIYTAGGAGLELDLTGLTSFTLEGVSVDEPTLLSFTTDAGEQPGGGTSSGHSAYLPAGFSGDVTVDGSFFEGDLEHVFRVQLDVVMGRLGGHLEAERFVANIIPEPTTALTLGLGLAGLACMRPRRVVSRPDAGKGGRKVY